MIQVDESKVAGLVSAALLAELSPERRDLLIQDALKYLITGVERKHPYGGATEKDPSPLEKAWRSAVYDCASKLVRDEIAKSDELTASIRALIADSITKAFNGEGREKLVDKVSAAIVSALGEGRY